MWNINAFDCGCGCNRYGFTGYGYRGYGRGGCNCCPFFGRCNCGFLPFYGRTARRSECCNNGGRFY